MSPEVNKVKIWLDDKERHGLDIPCGVKVSELIEYLGTMNPDAVCVCEHAERLYALPLPKRAEIVHRLESSEYSANVAYWQEVDEKALINPEGGEMALIIW